MKLFAALIMIIVIIVIIVIMATTLLAGCPAASEDAASVAVPEVAAGKPPSRAIPAGEVQNIVTTAGNYTLAIAFRPDPIPLNEPFTITVGVTRDGRAAEDVTLAVDARMPDHRHGMTRAPTVTRDATGGFSAEGFLFHMPGYWELYLDVTDHRGITERAQMEITLE